MVAAIECAREQGAQLVLADRRIEITLKRTAARLGGWTKIKALSSLLAGLFVPDQIDAEEIEKLKEEAQLADALQALAREFPDAKETLIDERDRYLAMKIREAPGDTVVAVVGAGHVEGIEREIQAPRPIDDLDTVPGPGPRAAHPQVGDPALDRGAPRLRLLHRRRRPLAGVDGDLGARHRHALRARRAGGARPSAHDRVGVRRGAAHDAPSAARRRLVRRAWCRRGSRVPTVEDLETLSDSITSVRGFWRHPVTRILLVVALTNLGASLGTFVAGAMIAAKTL